MTFTNNQRVAASTEKGLAALTRVFATAARDLQRCAPLEHERTLNTALANVGRAMRAGRAYVFEIVDTVMVRNTHEWCDAGVPALIDDLQHLPYTLGAPLWERLREHGSVQINDVSALVSTSEFRQLLEEQEVTAMIAAPFWRNGEMIGFVGLDYLTGPRDFTAEEDNLLRGFAAQVGMLRSLALSERESRRLENELSRARSRLSATVAALPELLVETDHTGVIIGFQQSSPLTFAATPQEVIGQLPETVLPAHLAAICRKAMKEVALFGWSQSHRYTLDTPLGPKWFTLYATARTQPGLEETPGYLFVVRDITHAERQNRQVRQLVRVAELSSNMILLTDHARSIRWMNPAATTRTGYDMRSAEGMRPSDILHLAEASPELVDDLCKTLDSGHAINREIRAQTRDGLVYWLDLTVQALHDSAGVVEGYMVIGVDTTAHKLAEARLLHERSHAMAASHDGIAIIRPNGRLSYANPALCGFLDIAEDARLDALMWTDVAPPDLTARMTDILPILMSEGLWEGELTRQSADGSHQFFTISLVVQEDTSTLAVLRNITLRKQAEQEQASLREQLQKAQGRQLGVQLAAGLAHDFANVLSTISTAVDVLGQQTGQEAAQTIARIRSATQEAHDLARGLTRLEAARPSASSIALAPILQQAADLLRPGLDASIRLEVELPDPNVTVHADRMEFMQLVLNLLLNARDACRDSQAIDPDRPKLLQLSARPCPQDALPGNFDLGAIMADTDYVTIEIADCGDGIATDLRATIFTPYVTTKRDQGAGLGLAVVADIVTTRSAALRFVPNHPKGTRVQVFWPCAPMAGLDDTQADHPLADTNILLVDNDDLVLQHLSDVLVRAGAEVASCIDPADALDAVTQAPHDWDLVLTDYDMGSMSGLSLARAMHDQREDLPIILMTGNSELHFATESVQSEFAATLRKPISSTVLKSILLAAKLRSQRYI
jgi:PAS domain S-box-containing protein